MIKSKNKTCIECGKTDQPHFSKKRCRSCASKSYGVINKVSKKQTAKIKQKKEITKIDHSFYLNFYENHPTKKCFECDTFIDEPATQNFHHLLLKSAQHRYSVDIRHNKINIVLVCDTCHNQTHSNADKTPRIKSITEVIKKHFEQYKVG